MEQSISLEETVQKTRKLIYAVVHRYCRTHRADYEEMVSVCFEELIHAYRTFDPSKGAFAPYLWVLSWYKMLRTQKNEAKKAASRLAIDVADKRSNFDLEGFLNEISQDAREVVELLIDPPLELLLLSGKRPSSNGWLQGLKQLLSAIGWTSKRITESLKEVREALQ